MLLLFLHPDMDMCWTHKGKGVSRYIINSVVYKVYSAIPMYLCLAHFRATVTIERFWLLHHGNGLRLANKSSLGTNKRRCLENIKRKLR